MRRTTILVTAFFVLTAAGTAQTATDVEPSLIAADSPLYGLDVAADKILKPPGAAAHVRASEVFVAQEANDTDARDSVLAVLDHRYVWAALLLAVACLGAQAVVYLRAMVRARRTRRARAQRLAAQL